MAHWLVPIDSGNMQRQYATSNRNILARFMYPMHQIKEGISVPRSEGLTRGKMIDGKELQKHERNVNLLKKGSR